MEHLASVLPGSHLLPLIAFVVLPACAGTGAHYYTLPVAPSAVIAACSAREIADAFGNAEKLEAKLTMSRATSVSGELGLEAGFEKGGAKIGANGKVSGERGAEKAAELTLPIPSAEKCESLGYLPELGRNKLSGNACVVSDFTDGWCQPLAVWCRTNAENEACGLFRM